MPCSKAFLIMLSFVIFLTAKIAVSYAASRAGHWPGWRGSHRDGISTETDLLKEWGKEGPPLQWKVTGLGKGLSTVCVVRGVIYTMGQREGKGWLLALDEKDGKERWATLVGSGEPKSTPTVDGDRVIALGNEGDLVPHPGGFFR